MNDTGPNKAIAGGLCGAATVILVWGLHAALGLDVPAEVAAAITVVTSTLAVWFVPHGGDAHA